MQPEMKYNFLLDEEGYVRELRTALDGPSKSQSIEEKIRDGSLFRVTHTLKGLSLMIGINSLVPSLTDLERAIAEGNSNAIEMRIRDFLDQFENEAMAHSAVRASKKNEKNSGSQSSLLRLLFNGGESVDLLVWEIEQVLYAPRLISCGKRCYVYYRRSLVPVARGTHGKWVVVRAVGNGLDALICEAVDLVPVTTQQLKAA